LHWVEAHGQSVALVDTSVHGGGRRLEMLSLSPLTILDATPPEQVSAATGAGFDALGSAQLAFAAATRLIARSAESAGNPRG
jgi:hypothetical protein